MHPSRQHAPHLRSSRAPTREEGWGVIELIIVLVVTSIIIAIAAISFGGAKSTTRAKETIATASSYDTAITQYQADHANRNPGAADMVTVSGKPAGPKNLLGKPYLKGIPDGVTGGRIEVQMSCASPTSTTAVGFIAYCPGTEPAFGIRVQTRKDPASPWTTCWRGNTPTRPRCA